MRDKGLIDVYILEILQKKANKNNPMKQAQLEKELKEWPYEVEVHRNTLRTYVTELEEYKYITKTTMGIYRNNEFSDQELRLLIDGVLFGHHIPENEATNLIGKLKGMSELGLKDRMRFVHYLPSINRVENKNLYQMIDTIDEAIGKGKKIKVVRCSYDESKQLKRLPGEYILDPYALVTEGSHYYLICHETKDGKEYDGVRNFRVDRMLSVKMSRTPAMDIRKIRGFEGGLRLDEYMHQHFYMMSGKPVHVTMEIDKNAISYFIDWYGKDFNVVKRDADKITIRFTVTDGAIIPWVLQYGDLVTVVGPDSLKHQIKEKVETLTKKYR